MCGCCFVLFVKLARVATCEKKQFETSRKCSRKLAYIQLYASVPTSALGYTLLQEDMEKELEK